MNDDKGFGRCSLGHYRQNKFGYCDAFVGMDIGKARFCKSRKIIKGDAVKR